MKNSFTLTEKILLALYQGTDEKALTYRPFSYLTRLFPQGNPGSLRVLAAKLIENGHLDKIEREGRVLLGITEMGKKELISTKITSPLPSPARRGDTRGEVKWDKKLHLVILSVPEKERQLRQKLRILLVSHNYRILHPGIWFCPVKNEELIDQLKQKNLLNYVMIFEATNLVVPAQSLSLRGKILRCHCERSEAISFHDNSGQAPQSQSEEIATLPTVARNDTSVKQLVISAWQLDKLQKSYEKYLTEAGQMQKMTHFDTPRYINLLDLQELLLITTRNDPFFSDEFMPLSQLRKKAWNTFQILSHKKML